MAKSGVVDLSTSLPHADTLVTCQRVRSMTGPDSRPVFLVTPDDGRTESSVDLTDRFDQLAIGVNAMLRWHGVRRRQLDVVTCGALMIDVDCHRVSIEGEEIELTPTEFRLLAMLARDPDRVFSRQQLGEACRTGDAIPQHRTIDVHIKAIRQKLGRFGEMIKTVHGVGYRIVRVTS